MDTKVVDEEPADTKSVDKELVVEELIDVADWFERTRRWSLLPSFSDNF